MQIIYNPVPWVSIQTGRGGGQLVDTDWLPARMAEPVIAFEFGLKYFELQLKFRVHSDSDPWERECRGQIARNEALGTGTGGTGSAPRLPSGGPLTAGDDNGRREQRRTQRQDLSRGQLLDAAERVFGEKGFHDASLREIAELAEFSVGSVYSFFDGKDDLFRQMFVRRGAEFMLGMHAVLEAEGTATEKLHMLIDFQIGFFRRLRPFGRLLLRYGNASLLSDPNELDAVIANNVAESMGLQSALFAAGQTTGEFRAGDATVLAHLFSGLMAAYQSVDPSIMSDGTDTGERLSLPELHQLVARAFSV